MDTYLQTLRDAIPQELTRSQKFKAIPGGARRAVDAYKHAQIMQKELKQALEHQQAEEQ